MTTTRTDNILRRHRYRPIFNILAPLLVLAATALAVAGVTTAGKRAPQLIDEVHEHPAHAECVEIAGVHTTPA